MSAPTVLDRLLIETIRPPAHQKDMWARLDKAYGIRTLGELLEHLPRHLQPRGELTRISSLEEGEQVTIIAHVRSVSTRPMKARRGTITEVRIDDGTADDLRLTWFSSPWVGKMLAPGMRAMFAGKVSRYKDAQQLLFPAFTVLDDDESEDDGPPPAPGAMRRTTPVGRLLGRPLIPIYPTTKDVQSWAIAGAIATALDIVAEADLADPLDATVREDPEFPEDLRGLLDRGTALRLLHQPTTWAEWATARKRLAFDEALDIQLVLARRRHAARSVPGLARPGRPGGLLAALDARLPFELTPGQRAIGDDLAAELADPTPMQRLLQGEVGSGKTVVALRAMLQVVDAGGQAALLAPTEVLAVQHARSLAALLGPLAQAGRLDGGEHATRLALLTGSLGARERRAALLDVASGAAGIAVGTHALLEEKVRFADLGLVVVDEQHRFGVEQRDALRGRGSHPPHVLVMTATPIPRTVAMTVFGDLATSVLRDRPAGRAEVGTVVVPGAKQHWLDRTWARVREEVAAGRQAFVVCPRIGGDDPGGAEAEAEGLDPGDELFDGDDATARRPAAAVLDVAALLADGELAGLRVAVLHGRLPPEEKDTAMTSFAAGELDVLVATTVIEVGVDVPNASVMVILDADRFGISQLHQLRGRIGRGAHPGVCLLVSAAGEGTPAGERLAAVAASTDGFVLAEADLEARREGDVLGAAQSGSTRTLKLLSLRSDRDLIGQARIVATRLVDADPELGDHLGLRQRVDVLEAGDEAGFLVKS